MMLAGMLENIVAMSDFSHGKAEAMFAKVRSGEPLVVVKDDRPVAVVLTPEEYAYLAELEEDRALHALAVERLARLEGDPHARTHTLEEVLDELGMAVEEIEAMDEVEFE